MSSPLLWFGQKAKLLKSILQIPGSTSGSIDVAAPATPTPYQITLPPAQGASGEVLVNDGSGNLSWAPQGSGPSPTTFPLDNTQTTFADVTGFTVNPASYDAFTSEISVRGLYSAPGSTSWVSDGQVNADFVTNSAPGINGYVRNMLRLPDDSLILVGNFLYAGATVYHICKIDQKGVLDTTFDANLGAGPDQEVINVSRQADGKLLVCGYFTTWDGATRYKVARLNADGTHDTSFMSGTVAGFDNEVYVAKESSNGDIMLGGTFLNYVDSGGFPLGTATRIFALNSNGEITSPVPTFAAVGTSFNQTVKDIAIDAANSMYYVCGFFTQYNGVIANKSCKLNFAGVQQSGFDGGSGYGAGWTPFSANRCYLDPSGNLFVCGNIENLSAFPGPEYKILWSFDNTGAQDVAFFSNIEISTYVGPAPEAYDMKIDSTGKFMFALTPFGALPNRIRRYNSDGTPDTAFNTILGLGTGVPSAIIWSVEIGTNDIVYVGGADNFTNIDGVSIGKGVALLGTEVVVPPVLEERYVQTSLRGVKKTNSTDWDVAMSAGVGSETGLDFQMTTAGQLQYKVSEPFSGTPSLYEMKFIITETL